MASNSSVLIDKSLLSKLDQSLHKIESLFALISGLSSFFAYDACGHISNWETFH